MAPSPTIQTTRAAKIQGNGWILETVEEYEETEDEDEEEEEEKEKEEERQEETRENDHRIGSTAEHIDATEEEPIPAWIRYMPKIRRQPMGLSPASDENRDTKRTCSIRSSSNRFGPTSRAALEGMLVYDTLFCSPLALIVLMIIFYGYR